MLKTYLQKTPSNNTSLLAQKNNSNSSSPTKTVAYFLYVTTILVPIIAYINLIKYSRPTFINPNAAGMINVVKAVLTGNISAVLNGVWGNIFILPTIVIHKLSGVDIPTALLSSYQLSGIVLIYCLIFLAKKLKFSPNIVLLFTILVTVIIYKIIRTSVISSDLIISALVILFYIYYQDLIIGLKSDSKDKKPSNILLLIILLLACSDQIAFIIVMLYMILKLAFRLKREHGPSLKSSFNNIIIKSQIRLIIQAIIIGLMLSSFYIIKYNQWHPLPLIRFNNQIGSPNKINSLHPLAEKKLQALRPYNYFSNWDDPSNINLSTNRASLVDTIKAKAENLNNNFNQSPNYVSGIMALGAYILLATPIVLSILIMYALYYKDNRVRYLVEIYALALGLVTMQAINYVELRHFYLVALLSLTIIFYGFNLIFLNKQYAYAITALSLIMIRLNSVGMDFERWQSVYNTAGYNIWSRDYISNTKSNLPTGASNLDPTNGLEIWSLAYVRNLGSVDTLSDQYWPEKIEALAVNYFIYKQEVNYEIVNNRLTQMGFVKDKTFESNDNKIYLYIKR